MKKLVYIFIVFFSLTAFSQKDLDFYLVNLDFSKIEQSELNFIEDILQKFHKAKNDTIKIKLLNEIVEESANIEVWPKYNAFIKKKSYDKHLSSKNKKLKKRYLEFYVSAINNEGFLYYQQGNLKKASESFLICLEKFRELKNIKEEASILNNLASVYEDQGDIIRAIEYYSRSLKIKEQLKDTLGIANTLNNIALIHQNLDEFEISLNYFNRSLALREKLKDSLAIANSFHNIGLTYSKLKKYDLALNYYNKTLIIRKLKNDKRGLTVTFNNIGFVYYLLKNDSSSYFFEKSLKLSEEISNLKGIAESSCNLATINLEKDNLFLAEKQAFRAYQISKENGYIELIKRSSSCLHSIYRKNKNWKNALEMYTVFNQMKDSLEKIDNKKASFKQIISYDYEKQKAIDKKEKEKQIALAKEKAEKQKLISYFVIFVLIIILVFALFIFKRYRISQKQKQIIEEQKIIVEEKNQEITDSISYAKRIQSAILPQEKTIKSYFPYSFILYKPKDIVAGDFYWFEVIDDTIFIAAADCTGHGVPGAMVSVVCHNALNRSIKEFNLKKPNEILNKTREIVISEFEKSDEDVKDGMDISLCVFNLNEHKLFWSGAHNPLWILRNSEIIEFKADKQPIGKYVHAKEFTLNEIEIQKDDIIYLFTDGFQDQFGGEKQKKFRVAQMKELFLTLNKNSMDKQAEIIGNTFENWKGDNEQIDDVCIIGLRL
jgi:serine phosphatase RsbU (regulator of sigma subunit)/tetratricopeptide (TPR) repeat protein